MDDCIKEIKVDAVNVVFYERKFWLLFVIICMIKQQPITAHRVKLKENDAKTIQRRYTNLPYVRWNEKSFKFSCHNT